MNECPWCGEDLTEMMKTERLSRDGAFEAHTPECEDYLAEQGDETGVEG
jgi:hypothetical protein